MEVSSSAITGSLRVGLQVVTNYKRPVLEIYHHVRNRFGPEREYKVPVGVAVTETEIRKHGHQDIFIQFTLINIGGVRAENVELRISGDLKRHEPREDFGEIFNTTVAQLAPGQTHFLFKFREHDLNEYPEGGGSSTGIKNQFFTITMSYNAPKGFINWFLSLPSRIRGKKQYIDTYTFRPQMVIGDLPPPEYVA